MSEHLLKAGANITPREGDELARLPYLRTWFRTRSAIILHLSNGCVQINFFQVSQGLICLCWGFESAMEGGRDTPNHLPSPAPTPPLSLLVLLCVGPLQTHPVPSDGGRDLYR